VGELCLSAGKMLALPGGLHPQPLSLSAMEGVRLEKARKVNGVDQSKGVRERVWCPITAAIQA